MKNFSLPGRLINSSATNSAKSYNTAPCDLHLRHTIKSFSNQTQSLTIRMTMLIQGSSNTNISPDKNIPKQRFQKSIQAGKVSHTIRYLQLKIKRSLSAIKRKRKK